MWIQTSGPNCWLFITSCVFPCDLLEKQRLWFTHQQLPDLFLLVSTFDQQGALPAGSLHFASILRTMLNLHSWCFSVYLCSSRFIFWSVVVVVVVVNKCAATRCCLSLFIGVNPSTSFSGVRKSRLLQVLWRVKAEGRPTVNICSSRAPQRTRKCPSTSLPLSISHWSHVDFFCCVGGVTWTGGWSHRLLRFLVFVFSRPSCSACWDTPPQVSEQTHWAAVGLINGLLTWWTLVERVCVKNYFVCVR